MNKAFLIFLLLAFAAAAISQPPAKAPRKKPAALGPKKAKQREPEPTPIDPEADRKRFDEALAAPTTADKAKLLRAFLDTFPNSELREEAFSYLISARSTVGSELVRAGDAAGGVASFKLAVDEAPTPIPDRMFSDVIGQIPAALFYSSQRPAAMELARLIEKKVASSPKQLLGVAAFYLGIENGAEARRVAEAAIAVDPNSAAAYQALGLAHRLNFDLDESANAYAKALELDPASASARRSLAEMRRAQGKPDEAAAIYRELLAANENDPVARQGLIISLFDGGHQKEAEAELARMLATEVKNFSLFTNVAYRYAADGQGDKAVEYAQKAVDAEPRYIWAHIALARGLMKQGKPVDAERALLKARQYGNFPTLDYELASARFAAGLYREAVEELQKSFAVKDGAVGTKLGGRVYREEKSFQDLLAHERRASILEPASADNPEASAKMLLLFELTKKLDQPAADETEIAALADEFANGGDKMKLHRQLHAAGLLLQKNVAVPKAAELVKAAVASVDAGLEVAAPGAAVMASELYDSRSAAFARNEVVLIPDVPRQTLSAIVRGRIEELAGWALYQQKNYPEATLRLRRAISVLPDKSAWWRSSMWRLGAALEADGKDREALESYIKSYVTDRPSAVRYGAIEAVYRRLNGSTDGLEDKIGPNPLGNVATTAPASVETPAQTVEPQPTPTATPADTNAPAVPEPAAATTPERHFPRNLPIKSGTDLDVPKTSAFTAEAVKPAEAKLTLEEKPVAETDPARTEGEQKPKIEAVAPESAIKPETPTEKQPAPVTEEPIETPPARAEKIVDVKPAEVKEPIAKTSDAPTEIKPMEDLTKPAEDVKSDEKESEKSAVVEPKPATDEKAQTAAVIEKEKPPVEEKSSASTAPAETKPKETKPPVAERKTLIIVNDPFKPDAKPASTKELFEPVIIKVPSGTAASGATRSRLIAGKDVTSDQHCSIGISQESIMLLSGGGSIGLMVNIDGEGNAKDVTASSNSPRDIDVKPEPEIEGSSGRRFFVIKSVSTRTGIFQVNFESPCGKREIDVHVR